MPYLSCKEIYQVMKDEGLKQTYTREYAYEFQLNNKQYVYVKRLKDTQKRIEEPSRLMIHPAFSQFPKCKQSECDENPTEYGIGVNFSNNKGLIDLLKFIESL